jgi:hypothetical protein
MTAMSVCVSVCQCNAIALVFFLICCVACCTMIAQGGQGNAGFGGTVLQFRARF